MAFLYFNAFNEVYVFFVCVLCGLTDMMLVNCIFSAPAYILEYYRHVVNDSTVEAQHRNFWNNALTYFNLINFATTLFLEPFTLTKWIRRVPMMARFLGALLVFMLAIGIILMAPAIGSSQQGTAVAIICLAGFVSGVGQSFFEATMYGVFSPFPPKYLSAVVGGIGVSGTLTSALQLVVMAAMPETFDGVRRQSYVYFGICLGLQLLTGISLVLLTFNGFARRYIADFGFRLSPNADQRAELMEHGTHLPSTTPRTVRAVLNEPTVESPTVVLGEACDTPDNKEDGLVKGELGTHGPRTPVGAANALEALQVPMAHTDEWSGHRMATTTMLLQTSIFPVLKEIYPMMIASAICILVSLMLFPMVILHVDIEDYWFGTQVVFTYNVCDMVGRFSTMWKRLWAPRWCVVAGCFARIAFIPLIVLASYQFVPSHAFAYVIMVLFGCTNGYFGGMSMVYGAQKETLVTDGQRFVAGTMMGTSILIGGFIGTSLAALIESVR